MSRTPPRHETASTPLHWLSLTEVARLIARGELSPVELVNVTLERIERLEPGLNAFLQVLGPQARERARQLERRWKQRSPKVRERLELGFGFSAVELVQAERKRLRVIAAFAEKFREVDVLAGATLPVAAIPIGAERFRVADRDEPITDGYMRLTAPQSMGTVPAVSLPCGFTREGLPIGLQLMAPRLREDLLLTVGAELQRRRDWHRRRPPLGESRRRRARGTPTRRGPSL